MAKYVSELNVYPLDGQYVAEINVKDDLNNSSYLKTETVIILDRSGSMGASVERIVRQVLPKFFVNLQCQESDSFHLIAFDDEVEYYKVKIEDLPYFDMTARGGTLMCEAVAKLSELFKVFHQHDVELVRILTISDGEVADTKETIQVADELAKFVKQLNISTNSQAVRWYAKADTTALCCLLQLNNVTKSNLVESTNVQGVEVTAKNWADLFAGDKLITNLVLESEKDIFLKNPWETSPNDKFRLQSGNNIFWLNEEPTSIKIDEKSVKQTVNSVISYEKLQELLYERIDAVIDHMKMLKIIESSTSKRTMKSILEYFRRIEKEVPPTENGFKFSEIIESIIKNDKVKNLSAAEKAEFLNKPTFDKEDHNLSKREAKTTIDGVKEIDDLIQDISNKFKNFGVSFGTDNSGLSIKNLFLLAFLVILLILLLFTKKTLNILTGDVKKM